MTPKCLVVIVWRWVVVAAAISAAVRAWRGTLDRTSAVAYLGLLVVMLIAEAIEHTWFRKPAPTPAPKREGIEIELAPGVFITAPPDADPLDLAAFAHEVAARIREAGR